MKNIFIHQWTDETAQVQVPGLKKSMRIMHLTDCHVALCDERDQEYKDKCSESYDSWCTYRADKDGNAIPTDKTFADALNETRQLEIDVLILTGDIIHFPSQASIEFVANRIAELDIPTLYVTGNHDWLFIGSSIVDGFQEKWMKTLLPLHHGAGSYGTKIINDIKFLWIDNSIMQISTVQLEFMKKELQDDQPIVLLIHIPISIDTLRERTIKRWKQPLLMGDPYWDEDQNHEVVNEPSTLEFLELVKTSDKIIMTLSGHIHFPHSDKLNEDSVQYVGNPGYLNGRRIIDITPMS
ncbi:MAG: hypothetical protein COA79_14415 [Planctomycetota bacterium]|nr:MAG: hypothetical protein COA79_14415 [Planctomycetota bacterium]